MYHHYFLLARGRGPDADYYIDGLYATDYDQDTAQLLREFEPDLLRDEERDLQLCVGGLLMRGQLGGNNLVGLYLLNAPSELDRDDILHLIKHSTDRKELLRSAQVRLF